MNKQNRFYIIAIGLILAVLAVVLGFSLNNWISTTTEPTSTTTEPAQVQKPAEPKVDKCLNTDGCKENGLCETSTGTGKCVATAQSCQSSTQCKISGKCSNNYGECVATTESCKASDVCKEKNECFNDDGKCVTATAVCESSTACYNFGYCTSNENNECIITKQGCQDSSQCNYSGQCTYRNGECVVTTEGCKSSQLCKDKGKCTEGNGECVNTFAGCMTSDKCKKDGECALKDGECSTSATGCRRSESCRKNGLCSFEDGQCVATKADCKRSQECKDNKICTLEDGKCTRGTFEQFQSYIDSVKGSFDDHNFRDEGDSVATVMFSSWAYNSPIFTFDNINELPTTSFGLIMKDADKERGKGGCGSGRIIQIYKSYRDADIFSGLINSGGGLINFHSVRTTGNLVEGDYARFCGVVIGEYHYRNSGGGVGHAINLVGMFDIKANNPS